MWFSQKRSTCALTSLDQNSANQDQRVGHRPLTWVRDQAKDRHKFFCVPVILAVNWSNNMWFLILPSLDYNLGCRARAKGNLWRKTRGTSLDLRCLIWRGPKNYEEISNLAALFGWKKNINYSTLVLSYIVVFLCPEFQHLMCWLSPRHLSLLVVPVLPFPPVTCFCLLGPWNCCFTHPGPIGCGVHPSAPANFWGRCLGPVWPSRLSVFPHLIPVPRSFTFPFLHRQNFASSQPAAFSISQKAMYRVGFFLTRADRIHICAIFNPLYFLLLFLLYLLSLGCLYLPICPSCRGVCQGNMQYCLD